MAKRENKTTKSHTPLVILLVGLIVAAWLGGNSWLKQSVKPVDSADKTMTLVEIPSGSGTETIANLLNDAGMIDSALAFRIQSKLKGLDGQYKAGQYNLSRSMAMTEIMNLLQEGHSLTTRVTIPEGLDIKRLTKLLADKQLIDPVKFADELENGQFDYPFLKDAPAGPNRLEGYLFPETYDLFANASEYDIINTMLKQFNKLFTDKYYARAKELNMDINQVITLASIIEREAVVQEDRPVISGVFHNRLEKNMRLQSCATVQYILGEQKDNLSKADIAIESPYNTYIHAGLPPGPIASPGKLSIDAALWPAETDYLYFLAKGDGSHVFSKTYQEHLANKAKYID
ncbi:MAG TPA: endolytic transglycosylase MltG [Clostridiales bacterium]|nr:endolytic transglycosylase MltG [Clostridiales bacterium]